MDSVVVRFCWVESRPCIEREVHLISSLVSLKPQIDIPKCLRRNRDNFETYRINFVYCYVTLVIRFRRYPEVRVKKLIVVRLFTFQNAFRCLDFLPLKQLFIQNKPFLLLLRPLAIILSCVGAKISLLLSLYMY